MLQELPISRSDPNIGAVSASLNEHGCALLSVIGHQDIAPETALAVVDCTLRLLVEPIQVFSQYAEWRPIGVRLDRPPDRSEGIGESPLHMDFVNAQNPPDVVVLYCERPDPAGGGETTVAPMSTACELDDHVQDLLKDRRYSDGRVVDLQNIGVDINPFAVLNSNDRWSFRYTGQLLKSAPDNDTLQALRDLDSRLRANTITISLAAGNAILIDQHKMVHGRLPLGEGQNELPAQSRRLIWQRFGRSRSGA